MKDIKKFLEEDHKGHLERSGEELRRHADHRNELAPETRQNYFYGITTVFPMMLLSHYYEWLTGNDVAEYMEAFVPASEVKYAPENKALLSALYENMDNNTVWSSIISSYMAHYPYMLLQSFANWALTPEQAARTAEFIREDRAATLPSVALRLSSCTTMDERVATVLWLGADFPFELLGRFHRAVME